MTPLPPVSVAPALPLFAAGHGHAPAPPSGQPADSFIGRYTENVRQNVQRDGLPWTVAAAGVHGLVGGWLGGLGGSLVGSLLPGPLGSAVVTTAQVAGLLGGFAWRLGRSAHQGHSGCH